MNASANRPRIRLLSISVVLILLNFCWLSWAQGVNPHSQKKETISTGDTNTTADSPSDITTDKAPRDLKKVDLVGKKSRTTNR
jgi:hypothetical protein